MVIGSRVRWRTLERWAPTAFVAGGGLLLGSPAHLALETFTDAALPPWAVAAIVLPGLMASIVGLLGLYPRLADREPRLALAGATTAAIAGAILLGLVGWMSAAVVLASLGIVEIPAVPPGVGFVALTMTVGLGFAAFGVAGLRAAVPSRALGLLLISFAVPWFAILGATPVYGADFPPWLALSIYGAMPVAALGTGTLLRMESARIDDAASTTDLPTGTHG